MSKRRPIIAGNWKCHKTVPEAVELAAQVVQAVAPIQGVEVALCPPFIALNAVRRELSGSAVGLGAQNVYLEEGAYTGEIAPRMLTGLCDYVIIGHSERRHQFGEDDQLINAKLRTLLAHDLAPILCVGEKLEQNERGETEAVVAAQLRAGFKGVDGQRFLALGGIIAYEPVWAIGTGKACHGPTANRIIGRLRQLFGDLYGPEAAEALRIQYGGSVKPANVDEFMEQPEIDGALVGGASLQLEAFLPLVQRTAALRAATE
ncbi:MAG: triose-phosphate isomerase [Chloroflexia bacterium]|nr:triose-phosphate isomerase [Chloroflexia bacterium]